MFRSFVKPAVLVSLLAILSLPAHAKKPLFTSKEPIQSVLSAPITQIYRDRKSDVRLYHDGSLSYRDDAEQNHKLQVKVRTRGNFRRMNCAHPPLRLNFKKKANDGNLFEKQDKLKLVGPCRGSVAYQEYLGLEYLVYQLWEEISPHHFRTRLLELSYVDTDKKKKPRTAMTFVIEDIDDVAKRSKRKLLDVPSVKRPNMDLQQTMRLELFQLLIGNSDYSTLTGPAGSTCCHNARLIAYKEASTGIIPVPYDFDVSGFVNAPYAVPAAQYPIKKVRQRYFTGWCKAEHQYRSAIQHFNDKRPRLYQAVTDAPIINERSRKNSLKYLDSFFELINNEKRVQREILGRCRGSVIEGP